MGPFGVMGGSCSPGTCAGNHEHAGFHDESARDFRCARWQWVGGKKIQVEKTFPAEIVEELKRRGHEMEVLESSLTLAVDRSSGGMRTACSVGRRSRGRTVRWRCGNTASLPRKSEWENTVKSSFLFKVIVVNSKLSR